jgi:tetratricopeptide repeat protein
MVNKKAEGTYEETLNKSEAFFMKHGKTAIIAIVAILVVVAGFFLYKTFVSEPKETEASTQLAQAQKLFQAQQFDQALKVFQKVQSDYSSTNAGNLANLYVGLCYAHQEKPNWSKALENVQKYSTSNDQIISPASQMALGDIYANNNQNDKAVESFKKAADMANAKGFEGINMSIAPLALRKAGIILESEGKKADALKLYEEIKTKYVNSPMSQDIDKYIERASN